MYCLFAIPTITISGVARLFKSEACFLTVYHSFFGDVQLSNFSRKEDSQTFYGTPTTPLVFRLQVSYLFPKLFEFLSRFSGKFGS